MFYTNLIHSYDFILAELSGDAIYSMIHPLPSVTQSESGISNELSSQFLLLKLEVRQIF
jgi:hypothetical protein